MSDDIAAHLTRLYAGMAEMQRRMDGMFQRGPVHEVDAANGTVRLRLGGTDEKPFLSPPIPYAQTAGALKVHTPPSKGQQMTAISAVGDFRQGVAVPMTWSNANAAPSAKGDEHVITFGGFTITLKGDVLHVKGPKVLIECGGTTLELTGGGVKTTAADYEFS